VLLSDFGRVLTRMRAFSDVPAGAALCYENSSGLMQVAVNGGRADAVLGLGVGSKLTVVP
jgi:S-adenosylmethionine hydrolase